MHTHTTHTTARLVISDVAFREILEKLSAAGYAPLIQVDSPSGSLTIDMQGISLASAPPKTIQQMVEEYERQRDPRGSRAIPATSLSASIAPTPPGPWNWQRFLVWYAAVLAALGAGIFLYLRYAAKFFTFPG